MGFNDKQIEKLSDLFMDIARGLFITVFGTQILTSIDFLLLLKLFITGILCVYFSLRLLETEGRT